MELLQLFALLCFLYFGGAVAKWTTIPPKSSFLLLLNGSPSTKSPPSQQVIDIDGFDTSSSTIAALKKAGKTVICYFSFGSYESWRPDAKSFPNSVLGGKLCENTNDNGECTLYWPGERWVDIRSPVVRAIMLKRIQLAYQKGCQGVDPDNMDGYANNITDPAGSPITEFTLTEADSINFLTWAANAAHSTNLAIGLKNAPEISGKILPLMDWALNEQCNYNSDYSAGAWYQGKYQCDYLNAFVQQGKGAFVAEYTSDWGSSPNSIIPKVLCSYNNAQGLTSQLLNIDLKGEQYPFANCLLHMPTTCTAAATWQYCGNSKVYGKYKTDSEMLPVDMIGQCLRATAPGRCPYK